MRFFVCVRFVCVPLRVCGCLYAGQRGDTLLGGGNDRTRAWNIVVGPDLNDVVLKVKHTVERTVSQP
jgi:hypothetical protein